jgi:hypothetical protein
MFKELPDLFPTTDSTKVADIRPADCDRPLFEPSNSAPPSERTIHAAQPRNTSAGNIGRLLYALSASTYTGDTWLLT